MSKHQPRIRTWLAGRLSRQEGQHEQAWTRGSQSLQERPLVWQGQGRPAGRGHNPGWAAVGIMGRVWDGGILHPGTRGWRGWMEGALPAAKPLPSPKPRAASLSTLASKPPPRGPPPHDGASTQHPVSTGQASWTISGEAHGDGRLLGDRRGTMIQGHRLPPFFVFHFMISLGRQQAVLIRAHGGFPNVVTGTRVTKAQGLVNPHSSSGTTRDVPYFFGNSVEPQCAHLESPPPARQITDPSARGAAS